MQGTNTAREGATRRTPLALTLKAIGYLTGPKSMTGKAFQWCERRGSKALERLAVNPTYLRMAGGMMRQSFRTQAAYTKFLEDMVHSARMPALSDVEQLEQRLARVLDKVEALESQLEFATRDAGRGRA